MIKKIFKKEEVYDDKSFLTELLSGEMDEGKLQEIHFNGDIDINKLNDDGESFLLTCMKKGKYRSALWLIKNGADIKQKDRSGRNCFEIALDENNIRIVRTILALELFNLNEKNEQGRTLLQDMVVLGHNEIAQLLIENGADINSKDNNGRNVIYDALSYGNERFIEYLLENKHIELNNVDVNNNSIMHHPQVKENDGIALKLIEAGADPTIKDGEGKTYLCDAALKGMDAYTIVDTALKCGADVNSRVANNKTMLMELIASASKLNEEELDRRKSLMDMSKKLLTYGIDKNAIDDNNETALFRAVRLEDVELVLFLLDSGVNPNVQNTNSQSVLMLAAYKGKRVLDIILALLKYGADPYVKNAKDQTLFEILTNLILHTHAKKPLTDQYLLSKLDQGGQYMVVLKEILDKNKGDLNFLNSHGNPLFFDPILYDHFPLFKLFMKYDIDIQNVNYLNHNIFFEYVLKVFNDDNENIEFQNSISALISAKLDHNVQDESGKTIVNKILETNCNFNLFDILTQVVLFDYTIPDNLGRSVMHNGVWTDQRKVLRRIHNIDSSIISLPDNYGILPITYAALLGSQDLVLFFIDLGANVKSNIEIAPQAVKKFRPMLKNLPKLKEGIVDETVLRNIEILIDQVQRDFGIDPDKVKLEEL